MRTGNAFRHAEVRAIVTDADGNSSPRWFSLDLLPRVSEDGAVENVTVVGLDVTDHVVTRAKLQRTYAAISASRDDFIAITAHEIRTPVAILGLKLDAMIRAASRSAAVSSHDVIESLALARRQVDRLNALLEQLLDAERVDGAIALRRERVNLVDLARETLYRFEDRAAAAGVELRLRGPAHIVGYWDRVRIEQVFSNVIDNALAYGNHAPVDVILAHEDDEAVIRVRDRGDGIAPEDRTRVFERFERCTGNYRARSLGLGLFVVREIVRAHGGRVSVTDADGGGSVFEIFLPMLREEPDADGRATLNPPPGTPV